MAGHGLTDKGSQTALHLRAPLSDAELTARIAKFPERLHCVAFYAGNGRYRSICLDLSLVAESTDSMIDAQERLIAQIVDYVGDVIGEGCPPHLTRRGVGVREQLSLRLWLLGQGVGDLLSTLPPFANRGGERASWLQPIPCR